MKNLILLLTFIVTAILMPINLIAQTEDQKSTSENGILIADPNNHKNFNYYYYISLDDDLQKVSCSDLSFGRYIYQFTDMLLYEKEVSTDNDSVYISIELEVDQDSWTNEDTENFIDSFNKENREWLENFLENEKEKPQSTDYPYYFSDFNEIAKLNYSNFISNLDEKLDDICYNDCYPIDDCIKVHEIIEINNLNIEYKFVVDDVSFFDGSEPHLVDLIIRLAIILSGDIFFELGCFCEKDLQDEDELIYSPSPNQNNENLWASLDLTSARMKPKAPVVPWWVYVGGGAVVTGVGIIILSDDDDPDDPIVTPPLTVGDATITVTCGEGGSFDPLTVSEGEGVRLASIQDAGGLAEQDGNLIRISPQAQEGFTLTFTMTDDHDQQAMGTLTVNVNLPAISVGDLEFEVEMGGSLEFNIFATINCPDCELSSVGGHPSLDQLEFSGDGNVSISFNPEFSGMLVLPYTVMNDCGSTASGLIRINIEEELIPPEANDVTVTVTCGEGGSVDPLANDVGEGLSLEGFETTVDWVVQQGDQLLISPDAKEDFEIIYTVINSDGLTDQATVFVTVIKPPFEVDDFNLTAESGQTLEFSVLDQINCSDCELISVTPDMNFEGEVDFQNGIINISISPDFTGETTITFVVRDACDSEVTGTITIFVSDVPCEDIVGELITTSSDCGLDNGVLIFATEELFGAYNFLLNGEPASDTITDLSPGAYTLTVIQADNENCREDFEGTIDENPFEPDITFNIVPGDCANSGDVQILVNEDPLLIDYRLEVNTSFGEFVYGYDEDDLSLFSLMEGDLGDNLLLGPVQLTFSVPGAEERCNQTFDLEIPEEEIPFSLVDLEYESTVGEVLSDNYLDYVVGTDLTVVDHVSDPGINFTIQPNGSFSFEGLEAGTYTVEITVEDVCGRQLTGTIVFVVEPEECVFDVSFTVINAGCGQSNGLAFVEVFPPNNQLEFLWNNGQSGQSIQNVSAGIYTVTIFDPFRDCSEDFSVIINEDPAGEYLLSFEAIPGNCNEGPALLLETEPNSEGFYILEAFSPEGDEITVEIPTGFFFLNDILDLSPGLWQFTLIDPIAGADCAQSFTVELPEPSLPELVVNEIIPPSGPDESDGIILISVSGGNPPYTFLINDQEFVLSAPGTYQVSGISPGVYEMIIIDADGCLSDVVVVEVEAGFQNPPTALIGNNQNGIIGIKNSLFHNEHQFAFFTHFTGDPEHTLVQQTEEIIPVNSTGLCVEYHLNRQPLSFSIGLFNSTATAVNSEGIIIGDLKFFTFFPAVSWKPIEKWSSFNLDMGYRHTTAIWEAAAAALEKNSFSDFPLGLSYELDFGSSSKLKVYGRWVFNFENQRSSYPEYGIQFSAEIR